jgi:hypothetical protein
MEWKGCGRKRSVPNLRYYPGICLEGLNKTTKTSVYLVSWPRFEAGTSQILSRVGLLTTRPRRSVSLGFVYRSLALDSILNQLNPMETVALFHKIHINVILPSRLMSNQ